MAKRKKDSFDGSRPDTLGKETSSVLVMDDYDRSRTHIVEPRQSQWKEYYKLYRSHLDESQDSGLMNELFVPMTFSTIESFQPALAKNRPRIEVWARGVEDQQGAAMRRALIMADWEKMNMAVKLIEYLKYAFIFQGAWWKVTLRREGSTRPVRRVEETPRSVEILGEQIEIPGEVDRKVVEKKEFVLDYDGPHVELCEIDAIYPDPDASSIDNCSYIIHETIKTLRELEDALDEGGEPLYDKSVIAELKTRSDAMNQVETAKDKEKIAKEMREKFGGEGLLNPDPHKRQFTVLERWTKEWVTTVVKEFAEDLMPLRHDPNPLGMIPFVLYTPIPLPGELYGISMCEVLYALNHEINTLHAARMDNLLLGVNQMYKVLRGGGVDPRHLRSRPGGLVWVDDMSDIEPFDTPPMQFTPYRESDEMRMWAQLAGGSTDTFAGLDTGLTGGTATEASLLAQASASRAGLMFQILTEQALKRLGILMVRIYDISLDQPRVVQQIGQEFGDLPPIKIDPETFYESGAVNFDVIIDVAATEPGTREFRLNRATQAIQTVGQLIPPEHPMFEHFMMMLAEGFGIDRPEVLIEQGREVIEARRQEELAAEQASAGGGGGSIGETLAIDAAAPFGGGEGG